MTTPTPPSAVLPLRMLNEYAYCPRLFHFMHVEGRWADNEFTVEGRHAHRRVDALDHVLPESSSEEGKGGKARRDEGTEARSGEADGGEEPPVVARSVPLASDALGLSAKLD